MNTNYTNKNNKLIFPELSYLVVGLLFDVHNSLGRFAKEKQYCDLIELKLKESKLDYKREYRKDTGGNIFDFLIEDKIVLEVKAKRLILKEDFYQLQRYLQRCNKQLGLIVNFRNRYLKPVRIIRIDTDARKKFI